LTLTLTRDCQKWNILQKNKILRLESIVYNSDCMSKIKNIFAREILASGGSPSLEVTVTLESGAIGEASVSYGASAGTKEATVLLDGDKTRYNGCVFGSM